MIAAAAATFSGCGFIGCVAPAVTASGPAATATICCGRDGRAGTFRDCAHALVAADGATGHASGCQVSGAAGDCFTARDLRTGLTLEHCSVTGVPPSSAARSATSGRATLAWGVSAECGADASVHGCKFRGMSGGGVRVQTGAAATLTDCDTEASMRAGYLVGAGGRLSMRDCRSVRDKREALLVEGANSDVRAANFTVTSPWVDGIAVRSGARAWLRGCAVDSANDTGVVAQGLGTHVWLQACSVACCAHDGVVCQSGAAMDVRGGSVKWTKKNGMHVSGEQAMCTVIGCDIHHNHVGVCVAEGGSAHLRECSTGGNNEAAFWVELGGALEVHACTSEKEVNTWLVVTGIGSTACARDCTVSGSGSAAVRVAKGASAQLHACALTQPSSHAVSVVGLRSALGLEECSIKESGGSSVVVDGGGAAVMRGTTVADSSGCGVEVMSSGAAAMDGCVVQGCAEAAVRASSSGTAVVRSCAIMTAGEQGVHARGRALVVALNCTLEAIKLIGMFAEGGALLASSNCAVSQCPVKFYAMSPDTTATERDPGVQSSASSTAEDGSEDAGDAGDGAVREQCWLPTGNSASVLILYEEVLEAVPQWGGDYPDVDAGPGSVLLRNNVSLDNACSRDLRRALRRDRQELRDVFERSGCFRQSVVGVDGVADVVADAQTVLTHAATSDSVRLADRGIRTAGGVPV